MAINRPQYVKEIDENVLPVSHGLFTPGSPYYSTTAYPAYNPTEAKKLVKQVQKSTGKPVSFTFGSTNGPAAEREQEYLQQAFQEVGFVVSTNIVEQNDLINNALAGNFECLDWRQFGAVDPDLTTSSGAPPPSSRAGCPSTWPATRTHSFKPRSSSAATAPTPTARAQAYQTVNKRLAIDLPYLWLDRAVWSVESTLKVQNWNNPTTPSGVTGLRDDRRLDLADADLVS